MFALLVSFWWALPVVVLLLLVFFLNKRGGKVSSSSLGASASERAAAVMAGDSSSSSSRTASSSALLAGVRVLELANTVAAPLACEVLAQWGAQVVKVEPHEGDMWRKFLKIMMPKDVRESVCFPPANFNKNSVIIDYSTAAGVQKIKELLKDCDVLVTNIRLDSLRRAGLFYDQVHQEFPHLIYASLTAWGSHGPDYMTAGYDLGAFYSATGMSARSCVFPGNNSSFASSFGDATTATGLASAILAALTHRHRNGGVGQLVSTSLLKQGCWIMSSDLVKAKLKDDVDEAPNYQFTQCDPERDAYTTKDGVMVQLLGKERSGSSTSGKKTFEQLREEISQMDAEDLPYDHLRIPTLKQLFTEDLSTHSTVWAPTPAGTIALPKTIRLPVDLSAFKDEHGPHTRPPLLGEHTDLVLKHGWSQRRPQFPKWTAGEKCEKPFSAVRVWELADKKENIVPQIVGTHMVHYGAEVWYSPGAQVSELPQLCQGKHELSSSDLQKLDFSQCDVVLTNLEGVAETLRKRHPHLIVAVISAFGQDKDQPTRQSLGPFTSMSGICFLHGAGSVQPKRLPSFPKFFGDFITANHLAMGVSGALYHRLVNQDSAGQTVSSNFVRSGMLGLACVSAPVSLLVRDLKARPAEMLNECYMVPTANTFWTKDKWLVTLMGVDLLRHLPRTLKALGFSRAYYLRILAQIAQAMLLHKSLPDRIEHVMRLLNRDFAAKMQEKTLKEWRAIFGEHDVWHTTVRMPDDTRSYYQAIEIGIFDTPGQVAFPITMAIIKK